MSDFVLRLARRAAGLAPTAVPRPPDLPPELLGEAGNEEPEMVDAWPAAPASAETRSVEAHFPSPARLPPLVDGTAPARPSAPDARAAVEVPATPRAAIGDADRSSRPEPAPRAEVRPALPPPVPTPIVAAMPDPRMAPAHPSARDGEPAAARELAEVATPAAVIARAEPRAAPEPLAAVDEPRVFESDGKASDPPPLVTMVLAEPSTRGAEEEGRREAPLPVVAAAPSEAEHPAWPQAREAQEEPRIEVHIGRIELAPPPPVFAPPPAPARVPRGFGEQRLARRHLDRRWY